MKNKLIGSAGSIEQLIKGLKTKWYIDVEPVCELSGIKWLLVYKSNGKFVPNIYIKKKGSRYRLEMEVES